MRGMGLDTEQMMQLEPLGTLINYNGYGATLDDLYFHPANLYRAIAPYANPFNFIAASESYHTIAWGFENDMAQA